MQLTLPDHEQLVEAVRRHGLRSSTTSLGRVLEYPISLGAAADTPLLPMLFGA